MSVGVVAGPVRRCYAGLPNILGEHTHVLELLP